MIDTSVLDEALRDSKRKFCEALSEKLLVAMVSGGTYRPEYEHLIERAWDLAEMQYDETMRRRAPPVVPTRLVA